MIKNELISNISDVIGNETLGDLMENGVYSNAVERAYLDKARGSRDAIQKKLIQIWGPENFNKYLELTAKDNEEYFKLVSNLDEVGCEKD